MFTRAEIRAIFAHLETPYLLMAQLLYGSGLRLMECLRLRIKDVDLAQRQITVRLGKGRKDRITLLPDSCSDGLRQQLAHSQRLHALDLAEGYGAVELPDALERKYPRAPYAWAWQYVFAAEQRSREPPPLPGMVTVTSGSHALPIPDRRRTVTMPAVDTFATGATRSSTER